MSWSGIARSAGYNTVKLPPGWTLTAVGVPVAISTDADGLVSLWFITLCWMGSRRAGPG